MTIRAVFFDLFDTLVDLHLENLPVVEVDGERVPATYCALHERVLRHRDVSFPEFARALRANDRALYAERHGKGLELPTRERFAHFCEGLELADPALPLELAEIHMAQLREQVRLLPHHVDVLAVLAERVPLALVSNFTHAPTAEKLVAESGLGAHLSAVVVSETVGLRKPRPEIFRAALEAMGGVAPERVLHVGDNLEADVGGAAALGMRTAWITRRVREPEERLARHSGPAPDHVIDNLARLPDLLDGP